MKKYRLLLVISCSFLLALLHASFSSSATWGFEKVAVAQEAKYSEALDALPHTALAVHADSLNVNSGGLHRHQSLAPFLSFDAAFSRSFRALKLVGNKGLRHFFNKPYLAHIYPSHNFW